jgi:hypothetical protein
MQDKELELDPGHAAIYLLGKRDSEVEASASARRPH